MDWLPKNRTSNILFQKMRPLIRAFVRPIRILAGRRKLLAKNQALGEALQKKASAHATLREQNRSLSSIKPLAVQIQFAKAIEQIGESVQSDCYVALLPSALPAAEALRGRYGGKVICDLVENVDVHKHSLAPRWDPEVIKMVNRCAVGAIADADGLMTVGYALADDLKRFGKPTLVVRNFRNFEEPIPDLSLRDRCGIPPDHTILFASGNVVVGFEPVLEALRDLPENFHLVALVKLKPASYEQHIIALINKFGISHRVHILPFVAYDQLAATVAAADIGLITSDVTNPNGAVALPNRCFDYLVAGLPVVAPPMPDVMRLIDEHGFGRIVSPVTGAGWKENLLAVMNDLPHYKERAVEARKLLTWESQEDNLFEFLGRPRSVTLLSFRDLSRYQRHKRLTVSLQKRGCTVRKIFWSKSPDMEGLQNNVDHFWVRDPLTMPTGIVRLEKRKAEAAE